MVINEELRKMFKKMFKCCCFKRLPTSSLLTGTPVKLKIICISTRHHRLKDPIWREADQLAI